MNIEIRQNADLAIAVMRNAGKWLQDSGKNPSKWWKLENLNRNFLFRYAKPEEFYVALIDGKLAAAAILQFEQDAQDWKMIDGEKPQEAMYIHWLCVHRSFAKKGLPKIMSDFAAKKAREQNVSFLRSDTNAQIRKLRKVYEEIGFELVGIDDEGYRQTAFYQKTI